MHNRVPRNSWISASFAILCVSVFGILPARASTVSVNVPTADIFSPGTTSLVPPSVAIGSGTTAMTFTNVTGSYSTLGTSVCPVSSGCISSSQFYGSGRLNTPDGYGPGTF